MKGTKEKDIPEFKSLEEERAYWEARGPLAEGHKGRINKPNAKRSSFLAVRLTGEELTKLRDVAAKNGMGPSTYARIVITSAIERESRLPSGSPSLSIDRAQRDQLAELGSKILALCGPVVADRQAVKEEAK